MHAYRPRRCGGCGCAARRPTAVRPCIIRFCGRGHGRRGHTYVRIRIIACSSRSSPGRDARRISQSSLDARLHNRTGERPAPPRICAACPPAALDATSPFRLPCPLLPLPTIWLPPISLAHRQQRHPSRTRFPSTLRSHPLQAPSTSSSSSGARSCSPCGHIHTHTHSSMPRVPLARPSTRRCVDAPSRCRPGSHGPPLEPRASSLAACVRLPPYLPTPYSVRRSLSLAGPTAPDARRGQPDLHSRARSRHVRVRLPSLDSRFGSRSKPASKCPAVRTCVRNSRLRYARARRIAALGARTSELSRTACTLAGHRTPRYRRSSYQVVSKFPTSTSDVAPPT
ncbi:hypothetical protein C8Q76DRAFT_311694 [Earliella scabrosa]|nr:hypothetical protein C8Q76DRAFT_311694 [Earliella scabrosa]